VVAVVAHRRGIERHQPDGVDAQVLDVVQPAGQPAEVADAIVVAVEERLDVGLVDDGVLEPKRIVVQSAACCRHCCPLLALSPNRLLTCSLGNPAPGGVDAAAAGCAPPARAGSAPRSWSAPA